MRPRVDNAYRDLGLADVEATRWAKIERFRVNKRANKEGNVQVGQEGVV